MRTRIVLLLCAVFALTVGIATATAGNSPNAKLCQKGSWQKLFTSTGSSFGSEEECVSYAAKGGTLVAGSTLRINVAVNTFDGTGSAGQDFTYTLNGGQAFSLDDDNNTDPTLPDSRSFGVLGSVTVAQLGTTP